MGSIVSKNLNKMTPAQLRRNISLLKVNGINRILMDMLEMYVGEIRGEVLPNNLPETVQEISVVLMNRYKSELPKEKIRVKQIDLETSIEECKREKKLNDIQV